MVTKNEPTKKTLTIPPPQFQVAEFCISGDAPYVQNKFSKKAKETMHDTQAEGSTAKKGKKREPKDFQDCFEGAQHKMDDGSNGIPAPSFRNAMIDACRMVGFQMTRAKCSIFVEADGFDVDDATPLVKITKGSPEYFETTVRLQASTTDLRVRAKWQPGWEAVVRVRFDMDQFTLEDVANLLMRAGQQVGIGEGRPFSRNSAGQGWGLFTIKETV